MSQSDKYRVIEGTHIQTRSLFILVNLMKLIGTSSVPIRILKLRAEAWSIQQEIHSALYRQWNGTLTINQKFSPKGFEAYLKLLQNLKLITRISDVVRCSRMGRLYLSLNTKAIINQKKDQLNPWEKLFLFYFLLKYDADLLLGILDLVYQGKEKEITIRQGFDAYFLERLNLKYSLLGKGIDKLAIHDKNKSILLAQQKKQQHAHKHTIPIRLEWLSQLGVLYLNRTKYELTENGLHFYKNLPIIMPSLKDIHSDWLEKQSFQEMASVLEFSTILRQNNSEKCLKKYILTFFKENREDSALRLPVEATLLYVILSNYIESSEVSNLIDLKQVLQKGLIVQDYTFTLKEGGRSNESYISVQ